MTTMSWLIYVIFGLLIVFGPLIAGGIFLIIFFSIRKKKRAKSLEIHEQEQTETTEQQNNVNENLE